MPAAPEGIPWLAWALVVVAIAAIGSLPGVVAALVSRRDMGAIKDQVKNTHTRNLREDLDTAVTLAASAAEEAASAAASASRTENHVKDIDRSVRALKHSLDRRSELQEEAADELREDLGNHIAEVPNLLAKAVPPLIAEALSDHLHDCPLRAD